MLKASAYPTHKLMCTYSNRNNMKCLSYTFRYACFIAIMLLAAPYALKAQEPAADTSYWSNTAEGTLTFSQVSLSNWAGGGNNSIALNMYAGFVANYAKDRVSWENSLNLGYGLVNQSNTGLQKSDDKINLISKFGYQLSQESNKLFWSSMVDLKTQFAQGFDLPNDSIEISRFAAPAYILVTTGLDYKPSSNFSIMYSPVTGKLTLVTSQALADQGAFGVDPAEFDELGNLVAEGKQFRAEIGTYIKMNYKREIFTDVNYQTNLELFSNYLDEFGNIDVNWENTFIMKVNKFLSANLITQLIYDDDIKTTEVLNDGTMVQRGARVQFKQIFGLGLSYIIK